MKNYSSFKLNEKVRATVDCYMTGLWTDRPLKQEANQLTSLYAKNWSRGLTAEEWKLAKALKKMFEVVVNSPVS